MAKQNLDFLRSEQRDQTQRSLGYLGFSTVLHSALLIAVLLAPSFRPTSGAPDGVQSGSAVNFEDAQSAGAEASSGTIDAASPADAAAASSSAPTSNAPTSNAPSEVLLADSSDPNAVALPAKSAAAAAPAPATAPAPAPPAEPPAKPTVAALPAKTAKPKFVEAKAEKQPSIDDALKAARTEAAKTKAAAPAAPAAVPAPAAPSETDEQSEVEAPVAKATAQKPAEAVPTVAPAVAQDEAAPAAESVEAPAVEAGESPAESPAADAPAAATETARENAPQAPAKEPAKDEAVPLEIVLPEKEALTQEQANALQASPTEKIPADAKPIEQVKSIRTAPAPVVAQSRGSSPSAPGTTSGTTSSPAHLGNGNLAGLISHSGQSSAGTGAGQASKGQGAAVAAGVPAGAPIRDARSLVAISTPKATYPLPDKLAGHQGTTVLIGQVQQDGTVKNVQIEKSSGSRLMDQSAASAFAKWQYKPGQQGYVRLPIQFQLVGDAQVIPSQLKRQ